MPTDKFGGVLVGNDAPETDKFGGVAVKPASEFLNIPSFPKIQDEGVFQPTELSPTTEFAETMAREGRRGFPQARQSAAEALNAVMKPVGGAVATAINLGKIAQGKTLKPAEPPAGYTDLDTGKFVPDDRLQPSGFRDPNTGEFIQDTREEAAQAGKTLIPKQYLPRENEKGVGPSIDRFLAGLATPEGLALPLVGRSRTAAAMFGGGATLGAADALERMSKADTYPEIKEAATDFVLQAGMGALIAKAAFKDVSGKVHTGANHPEILNRLGVKGFDSRESRNTRQFGFVTDKGDFLTRPQAAEVAKKTGQQLEKFDVDEKGEEQPHSDEIASPKEPEKPIAEVAQPQSVVEAWEAYSKGEIKSVEDLSDTVETLLAEGKAHPSLQRALNRFRLQLEEERTQWGERGDIEAEEERFTSAVEKEAKTKRKGPREKAELPPQDPEVTSLISRAMQLITQVKPEGKFQSEVLKNIAAKDVPKLQSNIRELEILAQGGKVVRVETGEFNVLDAVKESGGLGGPDLEDAMRRMDKGEAPAKIVDEFGGEYDPVIGILETAFEARRSKNKSEYNRLKKAYERAGLGGGKKKVDKAFQGLQTLQKEGFKTGKIDSPQSLISSAWDIASAEKKVEKPSVQLSKDEAFSLAASEKPGKTPVPVDTLSVQDTIQVGGEKFEVTNVEADGTVTIKDGRKFGTQILKDGDPPVWVEKFEPAKPSGEVPEFVGMGGAAPYEFSAPQGSATGIKNARVDAERQRRGQPPTMAPLRQTNPELWDRTMARIDSDPGWQDRLVAELINRPRPVDEEELLGLQHRYVDLQNEYDRATQRVAQAYQDQPSLVPEIQGQVAMWSDRLFEFEEMTRKVGSIWGRTGQLRQRLFTRDFNLADMERELRAARGGAPITDAERTELQNIRQQLTDLQKQSGDAEAEWRQRIAELEVERNIAQARAQAPAYDQRVLDFAEGVVRRMETAADAASTRLRERLSRMSTGVDPTILSDAAIVGSAKIARLGLDFARFTDAMIRDFGERLRPAMQDIWNQANALLEQTLSRAPAPARRLIRNRRSLAEQVDQIGDRVRNLAERAELDGMFPLVQRLVRAIVQRDLNVTRDALVDEVWDVLKTALPETTRNDAMDAISGYGRFTPLRDDTLSVRIRDLKGQLQQVAKFRRDPETGQLITRKTGVERRTPSDEERRLIQQVNEAKRRYGVLITDPQRQLKSVLDSRKTARRNQISDLEFQIRNRQRIVREKTSPPTDPELEAMIVRVAELRREFDQIFGRRELTDAQRAERESARLDREIAETERQLREGDIFSKGKREPETFAANEAKRNELKALKAERGYLRESIQPKTRLTPDEKTLRAYEARLKRDMSNWTSRMARGDFSPKPKRPPPQLPDSVKKLKAAHEKVKEDWEKRLQTERLKNRTSLQKFLDATVKWRQAFVISGIKSLLKLATASIEGMLILPARELAGSVLRQIPGIKGIAAKAPKEGGGFNVRIEAKALSEMWKNLISDFGKNIRGQKPDFEQIYGGRENMPQELQNYVGFLHGALKGPLARDEFTRSLEHRLEFAIKNGIDVTDPLVQMELGRQAWEDSQFWKFQNRNVVASIFRQAIKRLETVPGLKGAVPKAAATLARLEFPVITVPTNIVARVLESIYGLPLGTGRLVARAWRDKGFRNAVNNLKPEEADLIMRNLKTGSIGLAFSMIGFFNPQSFGGYYKPGQKKTEGEAKFGSIQVGGVNVPSFVLHNPFLEAAQFGATMRKVMDSKLRKKDTETQGWAKGLYEATTGAMESQPFVRESLELSKAMNPREADQFIGEHLRSYFIPMAVQNASEYFDKNAQGETVRRKPTNVLEHVEMGVPGLRQQVPAAKK